MFKEKGYIVKLYILGVFEVMSINCKRYERILNRAVSISMLICLTVLSSFIFSSCSSIESKGANNGAYGGTDTVDILAKPDKEKQEQDLQRLEEERIKKIEEATNEYLEKMTLEQKVGQLFMYAFRKNSDNTDIIEVNEYVRDSVSRFNLGGVILYADNIKTEVQTKKLITELQAINSIPMFIALDEEGGRKSRLNSSSIKHTVIPTALEIGMKNDIEYAFDIGKTIAEDISRLGFNMNMAPVADVNTNPDNPVIGDRSFGSDPYVVANMVKAEIDGMHSMNICTVIKHFPGHGDTSVDSHTGEVIIEHDLSRLEEVEFIPFKEGINSQTDAIMTAHIKMLKIDPSGKPATMSKYILNDILRDKLKYDGIIITDALEMGAITMYYDSATAAVEAFKAGADILLMPKSLEEAYNALINEVNNGNIKIERLNQSVKRIIETKIKRGIINLEQESEEKTSE